MFFSPMPKHIMKPILKFGIKIPYWSTYCWKRLNSRQPCWLFVQKKYRVHKDNNTLHAKISFPFLLKDAGTPSLSYRWYGNFRSHSIWNENFLRVAYNNDEERAIIGENDSAKPRVDLITKWIGLRTHLNSFLHKKDTQRTILSSTNK